MLAIIHGAYSFHAFHAMAKNLVFIGDSLTQWFDWQDRFAEHEVTNLGLAGEPVEGVLSRRERIRSQIRNQPDYIFLMTGANNILMGQYGLDDSYREIVRNLSTWYKRSRVVVQSLLPVDQSGPSNAVIRDVNRKFEQIARECNAEYLDVYSRFVDEKGDPKNGYFVDDGVHLSGKGYAAWAETVERYVKGPLAPPHKTRRPFAIKSARPEAPDEDHTISGTIAHSTAQRPSSSRRRQTIPPVLNSTHVFSLSPHRSNPDSLAR